MKWKRGDRIILLKSAIKAGVFASAILKPGTVVEVVSDKNVLVLMDIDNKGNLLGLTWSVREADLEFEVRPNEQLLLFGDL